MLHKVAVTIHYEIHQLRMFYLQDSYFVKVLSQSHNIWKKLFGPVKLIEICSPKIHDSFGRE